MPEVEKLSTPLTIHNLLVNRSADSLAADARAGLTARPKRLPPKYFYDTLGSHLFEAICQLPEYYLTRAETAIFQRHANAIVTAIPNLTSIAEFGSGSAVKSRYLIAALLAQRDVVHYQPLDISPEILRQSAEALLESYAGLSITGYVCDYLQQMPPLERRHGGRVLVLFLGSNIGNYTPEEARALLQRMRQTMQPGDGLLLGADLAKDPRVLEAAYDDALGVTAAFNLNVLLRLNQQLGADFNLRQFAHRAVFNAAQSRMEMYAVSRVAQTVRLAALDLTVEFEAGEMIHTEHSHKFNVAQLAALAAATGFAPVQVWLDEREWFSSNLWVAV
ncbi:MAG: L-histidine N(alpha)-methyltransferase [Acidobacteria bacterium]|nr:L-histidine N(alpha)-methyltransferase [Acidobacteriota bacterium]MBI3423120.1 L-histidine N(alpha)-methyltransferase [Acidobacteriota bacterium]